MTARAEHPWEPDLGAGASELARALAEAAAAVARARTPPDVYEGVCRALAERGIIALFLGPRGGDRYTPLAHRLDVDPLPHLLSLPGLHPPPAQPRYYERGEHPLAACLPGAFVARLPALVAVVPGEQDAPVALVALFAAGLTPAHREAMQTFAALLGAVLARAAGEQRLRELSAHLEERTRALAGHPAQAAARAEPALALPPSPPPAGGRGAAEGRGEGWPAPERERLSALLEGITDGVALVDGEGRVLASNPAGRALLLALGGAPGAVPAPIRELVAATLAGEGPRTVELTTPGTSRHIAATAARVVGGAGVPAVALTLHDTTEAVLMRERLFQSEKMASVGQLVSGVAHELNNPLTGILGFAQLLLARDLDAESRRYVETIAGEAERASKIVQNLLSFARRRRPEKTLVNLNTLVERVLELRDYELRVHDIEVQRAYAPDLPPCLADPHQIQQVLLNVLINAEQAVKSVRGPRRIAVGTASVAGWVRVTVQDSGPGIAPEHLRRVFDPFFTTKPVGEGTGLGLTISYGIVEEHQGRIAVDSRLGEGATVTIELPAAREGAGVDAVPGGAVPAGGGAAARSRILVVDDEQAIRDLLVGLLSLDGHEVEAARTGAEALQRLAEQPFDAIIADIRMPEMDGIEFYNRILHEHPELARRVIFTSGDTISPDTRAFVESTTVPFLAKPFQLRTVREVVRAVVEG